MGRQETRTTLAEFEKALARSKDEKYVLRLYVAGMTPKSTKALTNVKKICEDHLADRCELEVIDIYQQPKLAKGEQIIAAPTLIKKLPLPLRKLIGDMSDTEKFLVGLDLKPKKTVKAKK
jgi:circadian clock protein KaiB